MIAARELVSAEALRRYDDNGDPVYTTHERVLLVLRWFGWATAERVYEALGLDTEQRGNQWCARRQVDDYAYEERPKYSSALTYWVKRGRIERRHDGYAVEYRLIHPSKWGEAIECARCPTERVAGKSMCQRHLDWERDYKARRRAA